MSETHALRAPLLAGLALLALAGCQGRETLLPGTREAIRPETAPVARGAAAQALELPPPVVNASWSQRNGASDERLTHLAFGDDPQLLWSLDIGEGSSRRTRLIAAPIVARGLVFTLDAATQLSAVTPQGAAVWRRSLAPAGQRPDSGLGGGMTEEGGVLYVATGFGEVMALDPATGGEIWRVTLDAPVRAAPAVADGRVVVVARNDAAYALSARTGETLWQAQGAGGVGVLGGATPALDGNLAVVPFTSGEVLGLLARNGLQIWGTALTGGRRELVRNRISDVTGDPVIDGDAVYASNQSGRTASLDRDTGVTNWTIGEGAYGPVWPAGGSLFLLSDQGTLIRAEAETGALIWATPLPEHFDARRREAIAHYGPLLAGGRLWVASSDGLLRAFRPGDGALVQTVALPAGAAAPPAIAQGVMYVVTRDGRLHAFQ